MELLQPHDSVRETTISDIPKSKIRQYSMYHENRLVGDQMRFRQLELVAQRERAQFEWRRRGQDHAADDKARKESIRQAQEAIMLQNRARVEAIKALKRRDQRRSEQERLQRVELTRERAQAARALEHQSDAFEAAEAERARQVGSQMNTELERSFVEARDRALASKRGLASSVRETTRQGLAVSKTRTAHQQEARGKQARNDSERHRAERDETHGAFMEHASHITAETRAFREKVRRSTQDAHSRTKRSADDSRKQKHELAELAHTIDDKLMVERMRHVDEVRGSRFGTKTEAKPYVESPLKGLHEFSDWAMATMEGLFGSPHKSTSKSTTKKTEDGMRPQPSENYTFYGAGYVLQNRGTR